MLITVSEDHAMMQRCFGCMREFEGGSFCPYCGYEVGTKAQEAVHLVPGVLLHRRYTVGRVLGYGGFGVTYIGWDPVLEQSVAIKEYLPGEFSTRVPGNTRVMVFEGDKAEQFRDGMKKFVEEARHLAKFQNESGIVKIYDSFEENGTAYIIMEYLEGETLAARLEREGTIPEDEAVRMLWPVMESLNAVHQEGLLHRDIAPDNIFLTKSGEVKLIDFGASRYATTSHSRSLTVIIKPGYSPEEQYRSRGDQGPYTDVYAMAATLYRMITGAVPPDALERRAKYENANKDILEEPHKIKKGISLGRENAILNAMNVRIEDRTPDMAVFMRELEADPPAKRVYGKIKKLDFYRLPLWMKIAIPAVLAIVVGIAVLMLTGVISFKRTQQDFYIPEGIVMVPDVEGLEAEDAFKALEKAGLRGEGADSAPYKYITAGIIVLQSPGAATFLEKNGTVKLIRSSGVETEAGTMPDVEWKHIDEAKALLQKAGLGEPELTWVHDESLEKNLVKEQKPSAGTVLEEGTVVRLTVSLGPETFKLGNYIGMTLDEARKDLEAKKLKNGKDDVKYENSDKPKDTIIGQEPSAETNVKLWDTVKLIVSSGPEAEMVIVADVVGKTPDEAKDILENQGLKPLPPVEEPDDRPEMKGRVIRTIPAGGKELPKGEDVIVFISSGPKETEAPTTPAPTTTVAATMPAPTTTVAATMPAPTTTVAPTTPAPTTTVAPTTPAPVILSSIAVKTPPTKTKYYVGESLNTAGLVLTAKYSNGTNRDVNSDFTCSPTKLDKAGTQTITVTYQGKTATFNLTVDAVTLSSIAVKTPPTKTKYYVGESLNTAGLVLTAKYSNGTNRDVNSDFTCSPTKLDKAGTQAITVSYQGKSATFNVTVNAVTLSSISVKSNPTKTSYFVGESLDTAGLKLTAKYSDGSSKEITSGFTCSPTQLSTAGSQTITVSYGGKSATFNVTVNSVTLSSISIKSNPTKTSYFVGESLDTAGLKLTAKYSDGSSKEISSGFTCTPIQLSTAGTQAVTVTYQGKTTTFNVTVSAVTLQSISVKSNPTKTNYNVGESLNTAGLVLTAVYSDGSNKSISADACSFDPVSFSSAGTQPVNVTYQGKKTTFNVEVFALPNVGDIITMGYYGGEAIEWLVLTVENGKALLISRYGLDNWPYNRELADVTWEICTLRSWLNNEFYYSAFSAGEQSNIALSLVENKDNPNSGATGGKNTYDKLFLLSIEEAKRYFGSDTARICCPTQYAKNRGCSTDSKGACWWWLRSPAGNIQYSGKIIYQAAVIGYEGYVNGASRVETDSNTVRPAFWYTP